jgi:acetyl esterase/lipase
MDSGYWKAKYSLSYVSHVCAHLSTSLGVVVASLEYRRVGEDGGGYPGTFYDVAAGIAASVRFARTELGWTDSVLPVLGHSAGGHLALWYAAWCAAGRPAPPGGWKQPYQESEALLTMVDEPRIVPFALSPVTDLPLARDLGLSEEATARLMGAADSAAWEWADPTALIKHLVNVPGFIFMGTVDGSVPLSMVDEFAAKITAASNAWKYVRVPDCGHFWVVDPKSQLLEEHIASILRKELGL